MGRDSRRGPGGAGPRTDRGVSRGRRTAAGRPRRSVPRRRRDHPLLLEVGQQLLDDDEGPAERGGDADGIGVGVVGDAPQHERVGKTQQVGRPHGQASIAGTWAPSRGGFPYRGFCAHYGEAGASAMTASGPTGYRRCQTSTRLPWHGNRGGRRGAEEDFFLLYVRGHRYVVGSEPARNFVFRPDPLEAWGSPDPGPAEAQRCREHT